MGDRVPVRMWSLPQSWSAPVALDRLQRERLWGRKAADHTPGAADVVADSFREAAVGTTDEAVLHGDRHAVSQHEASYPHTY